MELLYDAGLEIQRPSRFPSWVPDWTIPSKYATLDPLPFQKYNASAKRQGRASYIPGVDTLIVLGGLVDKVVEVSKDWESTERGSQSINTMENLMDHMEEYQFFLRSVDIVTKSMGAYPTGELMG